MTQKELLQKVLTEISDVRQAVPNELQQLSETVRVLKQDVSDMKRTLLNPEEGVIVKVNKNTDFRLDIESAEEKQLQETQDVKDLMKWKENANRALWIIFSAIVGILVKLTFFDGK